MDEKQYLNELFERDEIKEKIKLQLKVCRESLKTSNGHLAYILDNFLETIVKEIIDLTGQKKIRDSEGNIIHDPYEIMRARVLNESTIKRRITYMTFKPIYDTVFEDISKRIQKNIKTMNKNWVDIVVQGITVDKLAKGTKYFDYKPFLREYGVKDFVLMAKNIVKLKPDKIPITKMISALLQKEWLKGSTGYLSDIPFILTAPKGQGTYWNMV